MQYALPLRTQRIGCSRIVGLYGGKGGGAFTELPDHCNAVVSKIFIRAAAQVDAIQLTYQYSNGNQYAGGYHGGTGGTVHRITINVSQGERVVGVFGRTGSLVHNLGFVTNWGRVFGPYGGSGGALFTVHSCKVRGIYGYSAQLLYNIGFLCDNVDRCG